MPQGAPIIKRMLLAGAMLTGALAVASAPAEDLELRWTAPPECPPSGAVERHIAEALVEHDGATRAVAAHATVEALLVKDGSAYSLDLVVRTEGVSAHKSIRASDCDLLARTTGLIVAVAIDPAVDPVELAGFMDVELAQAEAQAPVDDVALILAPPPSASTTQPTGEDPERSEPRPLAPLDIEAAPLPARRRAVVVDGLLRIFGAAGAGILPPLEAGVGLGLGLTGRGWRVEAVGGRWFAPSASFDNEPTVGADFGMWAGGGRACAVPTVGVIEIPLCAGGEVGQVLARGFGAPVNLDARELWAAVVLAPAVLWLPRPWLGIGGGADIYVNVVRPGFAGQGRGDLFRTAPAAGRLWGGIELRAGTRASR